MTTGSPRRVGSALAAALPGWLTARALVLLTLALAHFLVDRLHPSSGAVAARAHQGLLGWDAGFYQAIAAHGYGGVGHEALRFFPLVPIVSRAISWLPGLSPGKALLIVANGSALLAGVLLVRLARLETGDERLAGRAAWLLALLPPAFVLVMGYSEATLLVFGIWAFLSLRQQRYGWAAIAGLLAGLTRPLGLLLVLPAAVEAARGWSTASWPGRSRRVAAVLGPVAGTGIYLSWVAAVYGDGLSPLRIQTTASHRGGLADPFRTLGHNLDGLLHGHHVGSGLHVPWVAAMVVLVVVLFRWWPAPYGIYALATLAVSLSTSNMDSVERYALGAFPFVLVVSSLTASSWVRRAVFCLSAAGMVAYALLAFLNAYVP